MEEEKKNAMGRQTKRVLMHREKKGEITGGVIAGAQVPRLKNETKQDATLTLRLSSYPHKK